MSSLPDGPTFTLHLCSFAQDVGGLLTLVNAGIGEISPGVSLHLAGFISGRGQDLARDPLILTAEPEGGKAQEILRIAPPPKEFIPDPSASLRTTVAFDLTHWSAGAIAGAYNFVVSFAGAEHRIPLTVADSAPTRAAE